MSNDTFDPTIYNTSNNDHILDIIEQRISRRSLIKSSSGIAALVASGVSGCGGGGGSSSDNSVNQGTPTPTATASPTPTPTPSLSPTPSPSPSPTPTPGGDNMATVSLGFESVASNKSNAFTVPEGYTAELLAPWGTALRDGVNSVDEYEFVTNQRTTAEKQLNSVGMHHDGIRFFPLNEDSTEGLICVNHEYLLQWVMIGGGEDGMTYSPADNGSERTNLDEIRAEINSMGVSVYKVILENDSWSLVRGDSHNRRITAGSPMEFSGPVNGSEYLVTPYSADGTAGRGTIGNCGNGFTPWGTYLTCEENWPNFFKKDSSSYPRTDIQSRVGITPSGTNTNYRWDKGQDLAGQDNGDIARFNVNNDGASATEDWRNEANGFGYIVEIDPFDPNSIPVKHTAMGRFRHECCVPGKVENGKPLTFYSGHDGTNEYLYKFVTTENWDPADATRMDKLVVGEKYFGSGVLYVAQFTASGGMWIPLIPGTPGLESFADQAEILVKTLMAADAVNATPMDRPEWLTVDPFTHSVYVSLTNNSQRSSGDGAANPRGNGNPYGHILRWNEGDSVTEFDWDIFVFGSASEADNSVNLSGLTAANEFGSPDGLNFDDRGILWIQTDNSGTNDVSSDTNDQMLAVIPSKLRDGENNLAEIDVTNSDAIRRFLVGPVGCEITGLTFTPDHTTMFVNVQHPDRWPLSDPTQVAPLGDTGPWPRSTTVAIRRNDGGPVGE